MTCIVLAAVTLFQRYNLQGKKTKIINPWVVRRPFHLSP